MQNEEFQILVLQELKAINGKFDRVDERFDRLEAGQKVIERRLTSLEERQTRMEERQDRVECRLTSLEERQNEIYQVARAIEHSNTVGKANMDEHNVKISKHEGTFKKIAKVIEDEIITA